MLSRSLYDLLCSSEAEEVAIEQACMLSIIKGILEWSPFKTHSSQLAAQTGSERRIIDWIQLGSLIF